MNYNNIYSYSTIVVEINKVFRSKLLIKYDIDLY